MPPCAVRRNGATAGKTDLAKRAKAPDRDTVHEVAEDETLHDKPFARLLKRIFLGSKKIARYSVSGGKEQRQIVTG